MTWDRRKTYRFKPLKRVFVSLGSNLSQVGKIIDVSLGGLSFEFISDKVAEESDTHVDIFTLDETYHLSGLPGSLVYQASESLPGQKEGTAETFMTRRCGIKFHNLHLEQWCKLSDLIEPDSLDEGVAEKGGK